VGEPSPTESPKRSPRNPSAERESPLSPLQRLPQPEPRPRLPVRVSSTRPRHVKAAQVVPGGSRGALVLALTGVAYWARPHGRQHLRWQRVKGGPGFAVDSFPFQHLEWVDIARLDV
jgi:hypothetical protein